LAHKKYDLPAMPFYIGDWKKDPAVSSLTREQKMIWLEMIFLMWESEERGYLTVNKKPMSVQMIATALSMELNQTKNVLKILENLGIFSRRIEDKAIYSRRMVKLVELSNKRKNAGKQGGNPNLLNQNPTKPLANGLPNAESETVNELVDYKVIYSELEKIFNQFPLSRQRGREQVIGDCAGNIGGSVDLKNFQLAFQSVKDNASEDKYYPMTDKFFYKWREKIPESDNSKSGYIKLNQ